MTKTYLFVYGTLMQNIDSQITRFLRTNSRFIAEGKMNGYLYDVGSYPAAIHEEEADKIVLGQIFELKNVAQTLAVLDQYEGIAYQRVQVKIKSGQSEYLCWVYLYQALTDKLLLIESGNYLDHLSDPNSEHWKFIHSV